MRLKFFLTLVLAAAFLGACAGKGDTVTQVSTIDALLAGQYDGSLSLNELKKHGDFGIGTFDKLEGEMIVLDGHIYQAKADGRISEPAESSTPFASVSFFRADGEADVAESLNYDAFTKKADGVAPDKNMFLAVKAQGKFHMMKFRSVPAQIKPYPPLAEVVKTQSVYELKDVEGTIVGYRLPEYVKGLNVGGYHLHFIDKSGKTGGHILAFDMASGKIYTDRLNRLFLILPETGLQGIDLSKDRAAELEKVEK